jgi:hypothetical protein
MACFKISAMLHPKGKELLTERFEVIWVARLGRGVAPLIWEIACGACVLLQHENAHLLAYAAQISLRPPIYARNVRDRAS